MNILNKLKFKRSKIRRSDFSGFTIKIGQWWCEIGFFKKIIPTVIAIDKNHGRTLVCRLLDVDINKFTI